MKRYETEEEILKAIDHCRFRSLRFLERAELLAEEIRTLQLQASPYLKEQIAELKRKEKNCRVRSRSLMDNKSKELGKVLAQFRTIPFSFGTKSVVMK